MSPEAPRACATCATVTPHVRPPLRPSARAVRLALVAVAAATLLSGNPLAALAALAFGLALAAWAVAAVRAWPRRVCVRCARLRVVRVPSERPLRPWDELSI